VRLLSAFKRRRARAAPEVTWPARARLPTIRDDDPARFDRAYQRDHAVRAPSAPSYELELLAAIRREADERLSRQCARATIYEEEPESHDVAYRRAHADSITTLPDIG
jgi:hypothetical protein